MSVRQPVATGGGGVGVDVGAVVGVGVKVGANVGTGVGVDVGVDMGGIGLPWVRRWAAQSCRYPASGWACGSAGP